MSSSCRRRSGQRGRCGVGPAAEVGRNFASGGRPDQWIAGVVAAHERGQNRECKVEARTTRSSDSQLTLFNVGLHWKLSESVTLLGSIGHEFGTHSDDRHDVLFYLGAQFTH